MLTLTLSGHLGRNFLLDLTRTIELTDRSWSEALRERKDPTISKTTQDAYRQHMDVILGRLRERKKQLEDRVKAEIPSTSTTRLGEDELKLDVVKVTNTEVIINVVTGPPTHTTTVHVRRESAREMGKRLIEAANQSATPSD